MTIDFNMHVLEGYGVRPLSRGIYNYVPKSELIVATDNRNIEVGRLRSSDTPVGVGEGVNEGAGKNFSIKDLVILVSSRYRRL